LPPAVHSHVPVFVRSCHSIILADLSPGVWAVTAQNGQVDGEPGTILTIDDLILRPWRPADAPELFAVCQDPEIARWVTIPQPFLPADADAFIQNAMAMWRDGTGAPFAIVDAATDRLLGAVTRFGPEGHQATFGLWLAPDSRGRGVGTRALRLVSDWTFATTAAIRLDAFIMVGNEASNRMTERAGFQREGVLRAWDMHHDGVPVDCVVYSRIRGDS
jgi:RimJ/RimL family protein N-acetyltransferase